MNRTGRNSSHSARTLAVLAIMLAAALALGGTALAGGGHQAVRTDGPVAIGGQVHPAGLLELERTASSRQLWAVMIDGRRVALIFRDPAAGAPGFVLYRDEAGLLHHSGVQVAQVAGGASEYVYRRSGQVTLHAAVASSPGTWSESLRPRARSRARGVCLSLSRRQLSPGRLARPQRGD